MALPLVIEDRQTHPAIAVLMRLPLVLVLVAPVMVEPGIVVPVIMPIVIVALASASTIVVAAPIVVPLIVVRRQPGHDQESRWLSWSGASLATIRNHVG